MSVPVPTISPDQSFSVIIAANNEEGYIGACLDALRAQDVSAGLLDVVVVANGCTDRTEEIVDGHIAAFATRGWKLQCLHRPEPGKVGALNAGDHVAKGALRAYLDADVICSPALFGQLRIALAVNCALYATGALRVVPARSWITRQYARFWEKLPFVQSGAVGAGLFALNAQGRALWTTFPNIISDDTFVRLHFPPSSRIEVPAYYDWPMIEGWWGLVKVKRRQDEGVREIYREYPELMKNEGKARLGKRSMLSMALHDPIGFIIYTSIQLLANTKRSQGIWARGR